MYRMSREEALAAGHYVAAKFYNFPASKAWCADHGIRVERAQVGGVDPPGGFLVPNTVADAVIAVRDSAGIFRRNADTVTLASDQGTWPRRTSGLTASFTPEGSLIVESGIGFDAIGLSLKKLATLTRLSAELVEDALADVGRFFVEEIAYALYRKEDLCGFLGDGSAAHGGIVGVCPQILDGTHDAAKVPAAAGHSSFSTLTADDLAALVGALPANALDNACWYCSAYAFAMTMVRLGASVGQDVTDPRGPPLRYYLGFPVWCTSVLPGNTSITGKVSILFGDLRQAATLGSRRAISVTQSERRWLELDQLAIKGSERFDINVHDLGDATNPGMIAGLVGA